MYIQVLIARKLQKAGLPALASVSARSTDGSAEVMIPAQPQAYGKADKLPPSHGHGTSRLATSSSGEHAKHARAPGSRTHA